MKRLKIALVIDKLGYSEPLTTPLISALAKKGGHDVRFFVFNAASKKGCRAIVSFGPDIMAYSICSNEAQTYLKINKELKKQVKFFSVFGGPHPTFYPSFVEEEGVDSICRGEADSCLGNFLDNFNKEEMYETDNFCFKTADGIKNNPMADLVADLDTIPFPDRDIIYEKSYFLAKDPIKTFMSGRGCPYSCTYCFNHVFNKIYEGKGPVLRYKSVGYIIEEINQTSARYPLTFVKFHDDIFGSDNKWLEEFAVRYPKEVGLPFLCYARPNIISEDYARLLKEAGCYSITMAIECGSEKIRNLVLRRNMEDSQIIRAAAILRRHDMKIQTLNMLGLPGETDREIMQTVRLNQKIAPAFADASIFQPYPGTEITRYCKEAGYLDERIDYFESPYVASILNFDTGFKSRIYVIHRLFSMLVDHPRLCMLLKPIFKLSSFFPFRLIINLAHRLYYGQYLHSRIYASSIPFYVRLRGAFLLLFSRNRV